MIDAVRLYLLLGLVAHKVVWEILKRRQRRTPRAPARPKSPIAMALKSIKVTILLALVAQTFLPDVMPIVREPRLIRIVGLVVFTLGLGIAVLGRLQLGDDWADIEAAHVLQQQRVVSQGVYRYIRHPIYVGDLVLLLGFQLAVNSWLLLGVVAMAPYVAWRAMREERMLSALPGYDAYCARTWRFVPFLV